MFRIYFVATFLVALQVILADGQRTHVEVGRRALDRYCQQVDEMLPGFSEIFETEELKASYFAGCMFPDWAFPNVNNPASEDAHWKRYQEPYFAMLDEKCSFPWDDDEKRRVAFFMGIVCHGMADLPWHFSKEGQASLLERSFANDRATHFDTEYSYDLFLYKEGTPPQKLIPKLWWPIADIKDAYRRMGTVIPDGQLENMFTRTNVMINAGPLAASMTADGLKTKYPWVMKNVDGYYFGGVQNGGALTASWLKYYYARLRGGRYYQNIPTALAEDRDERVYAGTTDASLLERLPKNNTGNEPFLDLSGDSEKDRRASVVRFNVGDWPADKPIERATLWLYFAGWQGTPPTGDKEIVLAAVDRPWEEGVGATSDVNGTEGQPHPDQSVSWSNMMSTAIKSPVGRRRIAADKKGDQWLSWDVTELARQWITQPNSNHGMMLTSSSPGPGIARFYSSEAFRTQEQAEDTGGGFRIVFRPTLILWPKEER